MFLEDQLLPLSALQHFLFCERQCALIHLEQAWAENKFTAEGRIMHERAHHGPDERRPGLHAMIESRTTPPAAYDSEKCDACSLLDFCQPKALRFIRGVASWFAGQITT